MYKKRSRGNEPETPFFLMGLVINTFCPITCTWEIYYCGKVSWYFSKNPPV